MSTVAIYGATGNLGKSALPHFIQKHKENKLKLVILHRPGSNIASLNLPSDVETRAIDLEKDLPASEFVETLKGIDIVVPTAMAFGAENVLFKLIEALGKTGRKTLIFDPLFGARARGDIYPELAGFAGFQGVFAAKGKEAGVEVAEVRAGMFASWFFDMGFSDASVKDNTAVVNETQMKNGMPVVSTDYLGGVLAELSSRPIDEIAGETHSAVEHWVTGQAIVDALEKINGARPELKDWTRADFERVVQELPMGSVKATYFQQWSDATFQYPNEVTLDNFTRFDVEESFRRLRG